MDLLEQSEFSAAVRVSETEAKVLSLAMQYWLEAMDPGSPLVDDLSERLQQITADFDALFEKSPRRKS